MRAVRFFWAIIIVSLLCTNVIFYILEEEEKALRISTQQQLAKITNEKIVVEKELIDATQAKKRVEEELTMKKGKSLTLENELEEKKRQMKLTSDELEEETAARREVQAQLVLAMKEKEILEDKVRKLSGASKVVELERIVVESGPGLAGKVLGVNRDYGFVIVNLGRRNNLKLGDVLAIYRDDEFVGKAQVERLEEKICAATILSEWKDVEFKENDMVTVWY